MGWDKGGANTRQVDVVVSPFYLDQFEVTYEQFLRFLNERGSHLGCSEDSQIDQSCIFTSEEVSEQIVEKVAGVYRLAPKEHLPKDRPDRLVTLHHPARYVTWAGAHAYCAWVGRRLPTDAEWEYAARFEPFSGALRAYPWGNELDPVRRFNGEEPITKDGFIGSAPVGSFSGTGRRKDGRSPFGVHDLVGNAKEWVEDCSGITYRRCGKPVCIDPVWRPCDHRRILRGTGFLLTIGDLRETAQVFDAPDGSRGLDAGFRCARSLGQP